MVIYSFYTAKTEELLMKQSKYNTHRCVHSNCGRYLSQIQSIVAVRLSIFNISTINRWRRGKQKGSMNLRFHDGIDRREDGAYALMVSYDIFDLGAFY